MSCVLFYIFTVLLFYWQCCLLILYFVFCCLHCDCRPSCNQVVSDCFWNIKLTYLLTYLLTNTQLNASLPRYIVTELLGPFYGAIVVPSVTRCRCRCCRCRRCCCGHRCAGSVRQWRCDSSDTWWMVMWRRLTVANGPNIFQMLLVYYIAVSALRCNRSCV